MAYQNDAPLLPSSLKDRIKEWLGKGVGFVVLAGCAAGAVSLLTWTATDPSLTQVTSGPTHNGMGPLGAIFSDLVMQMVGLAAVFALLPPLVWSLQLLTIERVCSVRLKLLLAPTATLFLAGAFSSLPRNAAWPLHHGYGGILGDFGLEFLSGLLLAINPDRAWAAAGLFYLAGGLLVLVGSLGLSQQDLELLVGRDAGAKSRRLAAAWRRLRAVGITGLGIISPRAQIGERIMPAFTDEPREALDAGHTWHNQQMDFAEHEAVFDAGGDDGSQEIAGRFTPFVGTKRRGDADAGVRGADVVASAVAVRQGAPAYKCPSLSILKRAPAAKADVNTVQPALRGNARLLQGVLNDFGVKGEVKAILPGPVVTLFEFEPARGTKSSRVIALADDIARSMSAASARVAIVPGRNVIGIELPNSRREKVYLRELFESEAFRATDATLPLALGKSIDGTPVFADLARMPHLLVAGTTGSGKSVGVNSMILSLLYRLSPEQCRFLMVDPKMLELSVYNGIPHLLAPVVTDAHKAVAALNWVVREMEDRYRRMASVSVRNIDAYNNRLRARRPRDGQGSVGLGSVGLGSDGLGSDGVGLEPMPYIVVVVDEFADLMVVAGREIEGAVQRLAQMARAAGIHLIMATQRPSVDIITGTIKANFPTRISFKVASKIDSRTILGEQGAEQLLGQGDMIFASGVGRMLRVHGPFVSDEEVESSSAYLRALGRPRYVAGVTDLQQGGDAAEDQSRSIDSDLYERAVATVLRDQKASTSYIQRRLSIGYNRAADLVERMEHEGIISSPDHQGRRQIRVAP
jgi:S-DNA-T family DNA segregation ATPase FtsK/SpoIIIE